jgi:acyl-CoA thioester hydrolase
MDLHLRIDWADLDLFGHVNNVAFFKFIQAGRVQLCDAVGLSSTAPEGIGFIVASSHCDFKLPLYYPDTIKVTTSVLKINSSSFELAHSIYNSNNQLAAEGKDVLVVFDYMTRGKVVIFEALRSKLISCTLP